MANWMKWVFIYSVIAAVSGVVAGFGDLLLRVLGINIELTAEQEAVLVIGIVVVYLAVKGILEYIKKK